MSDSKCKNNVVSQSVALNTTVEQLQRWGEDVSNDGLDAISTSYNFVAIFRPFIGSRQMLKCLFLLEQSYVVAQYADTQIHR